MQLGGTGRGVMVTVLLFSHLFANVAQEQKLPFFINPGTQNKPAKSQG